MKIESSQPCPCGTSKNFGSCCKQYISGESLPDHPEALMRSRYAAYVVIDLDYIKRTTDPQTLHKVDFGANAEWAKECDFIGLEVIESSAEGNKGLVEFRATYKVKADGATHIHHELSKFRKQGGKWFYRDGRFIEPKEE